MGLLQRHICDLLWRKFGPWKVLCTKSLTAKIMRNNGQHVHMSTYRAFKPDELVNPDEIKDHDVFDTSIEEKLGPAASAKCFQNDMEIVTLTLYWYEDDKDHQTHMPEVDEITPEAIDNYIGVDIMISHGDTGAQGSVRRRKRDVEGNTIRISNSNTILDTQTYEVEFKDGSMSTSSANVIAESMYAQGDDQGQKYLLFGSILDHKIDGHALQVADQDVVVCA